MEQLNSSYSSIDVHEWIINYNEINRKVTRETNLSLDPDNRTPLGVEWDKLLGWVNMNESRRLTQMSLL